MSRGDKRRSSSDTFRFSAELDKVIHKLTKDNPSVAQTTQIIMIWEEICPDYIYNHTSSISLRGSKLVIAVDSPTFVTDLSAMSEVYREEINQRLGSEQISAVTFFVARKGSQSTMKTVRHESAPEGEKDDDVPSVQLTDLERAQIEESVSGIENPKLREALLAATIADLEWKKGIRLTKSPQKPN